MSERKTLNISLAVFGIFVVILAAYHLAGNASHMESMLLGMGMGAAFSGPMMYFAKKLRQKIRERRILKDLAEHIKRREVESESARLEPNEE